MQDRVNGVIQNKRKIRVCMLSFYFPPSYSGSAIQARNLSLWLKKLKVEPFILSANLSNAPSREVIDGIEVFRVPVWGRGLWAIVSFWVTSGLFLLRNCRRWEIVHAHGTLQHGAGAMVAWALRRPSILKIAMADSDIAFHRQGRIWGRVNRFLVSKFSRFIATSQEVFDEFESSPLGTERVVKIPNGVDTDHFQPVAPDIRNRLRQEFQLGSGPVVVYAGVIHARKNVDLLLRVWNTIVRSRNQGILLLVGPSIVEGRQGSQFYSDLQRYVRLNALEEHVRFAGEQSDIAPYLQAADVFFFPSHREGMPNVLLEAMACGLPCIASRASGIRDLIDNGVDGFTIPATDEDAFTDKLQELLENQAMRLAIGNRAREKIRERFSLAGIAERYQQLYRRILDARRQKSSTRRACI